MITLLEQLCTPGAGIAAVLGFALGTATRTLHGTHLGRNAR